MGIPSEARLLLTERERAMNKATLTKAIKQYPSAVIEQGFPVGSQAQQEAALLTQKYIQTYPELADDMHATALILWSLGDLQVRDYALGLVESDNLSHHAQVWTNLTLTAPKQYRSAPASILSAIRYEQNDKAEAMAWLLQHADFEYPLAKLLRRVYNAEWKPSALADLRKELHPKVTAKIFGEEE